MPQVRTTGVTCHKHACTDAQTHVRAHVHTHAYTHTHTHTLTNTCTYYLMWLVKGKLTSQAISKQLVSVLC